MTETAPSPCVVQRAWDGGSRATNAGAGHRSRAVARTAVCQVDATGSVARYPDNRADVILSVPMKCPYFMEFRLAAGASEWVRCGRTNRGGTAELTLR